MTFSQSIIGTNPAEVNSTPIYSYDDGNTYIFPTWIVTGGTIVSSHAQFTNYTVVIQWDSAPGTGTVTFKSKMLIVSSLMVDITLSSPTPPPTPDMPTITNNCNSTRLTRGSPPSSSPPSVITWYWQDSASGQSYLNSEEYVDRTSGTVYWLRAHDSSTDLWSTQTVNYTITQDACSSGLSNENYIYTVTPKIETTDVSGLTNGQKMESITYFEGLGRPMQSIGIRAGGSGQDIVMHIGYDGLGRQDKDYLPYSDTINGGLYRTGSKTATLSYYDNATRYDVDFPGMTTADINPYSEKHFEASPLNRVLEQGAPGAAWTVDKSSDTDHTIKFDHQTNTDDEVKLYGVDLSVANKTYTPTLTGGTSGYGANELYKTVTKDENWVSGKNHTTEEFKDKQGRVVLKRTYANIDLEQEAAHDTYYVYDDHGNLTYVLPPKSEANVDMPNATELAELCYQYKYDHRNRLIEKKIPGKGDANTWEEIVYDKLDRPVLTQDANLKANEKWLYTKYDAFDRVVYTGLFGKEGSTYTRSGLQSTLDNLTIFNESRLTTPVTIDNTDLYYTAGVYPGLDIKLYTINYYDNYTFDKDGLNLPSTAGGEDIINNDNSTQILTKGLTTGSKVRILGTTDWITTLTGYDVKGQLIYITNKNNYLSTADIVVNELDFVGSVDKSTTTHAKTGQSTITTIDTFTYDDAGRLLSQKQQINTQPEETIVENIYDDLGQLEQKSVGGKSTQSRLQTVDYAYNIRGWLKGINDVSTLGNDLFGFKLNYNDPTSGTALYNGNISQTQWKTDNTDASLKTYAYNYDALNRITSAIDNTTNQNYSLQSVSYDKNGNIQNLLRNGHTDIWVNNFGAMDNLSYYYNGNQLHSVSDSSGKITGFNDGNSSDAIYDNGNDDYSYDMNGNLISDANKGITAISYNHLNLPTQVTFASGNIQYFYDAKGTKLKKTTSTGATTEYAGNFVYKDSSLEFFNHPEGYVKPDGSSYDYVYQYKDHLSNIRLSYSDLDNNGSINASTEILQEKNYYPFGLKHKGYNNVINGTDHPYGFGGKEEQDELGLNWIDITARNYDPALGRWMNLDPLAEQMRRHSPYNYAFDNPIYFVDYDGMAPTGPGDPPINPLPNQVKDIQPFVPSEKTTSLLEEGKELLSNVFDFSLKAEAKVGVGGEGQIGPVKVKAEANYGSASVEVDKDKLKVSAKAIEIKASGSVGSEKSDSSIKGNFSFTAAEANYTVDKNLNTEGSLKGANFDASGTLGKGKDLKLTLKDNLKIGLGGKVGMVKAKGSMNLYNAVAGTTKMVQGMASWLGDYVSNIID